MTLAYLITSSIEATTSPLTYSKIRSIFDSSERLRQTGITLASISRFCDQKSKIFLLDTSLNWKLYQDHFSYLPNLKFVSVKQEFPEIYEEAVNHQNKSRCESLITKQFLIKYRDQIEEFDSVVKISGRYFIDSTFNTEVLDKNKLIFKQPLKFDWQDWWNYDMVKLEGYSQLYQYSSSIFGWGTNHFDNVLNLYTIISDLLSLPNMQHYDLETLLYFFTRPLKEDIIETDWMISGWLGTTGQFVRY